MDPATKRSGAIAISCFLVTGRDGAEVIVRGSRWRCYGLADISVVRGLGCEVVLGTRAGQPVVGEHVLVSDGGDPEPYDAVITELRSDGSFVVSVLAFAPAPAI